MKLQFSSVATTLSPPDLEAPRHSLKCFSSLCICTLCFGNWAPLRDPLFLLREACQSKGQGARARAPEAAPRGAGQGSSGVGEAEEEGDGPGALQKGEVRGHIFKEPKRSAPGDSRLSEWQKRPS